MKKPLQVLLVEDSEDDARLVVRELARGGYDVTSERVETAGAMRTALERGRWDLVICDYQMPRFSGPAAIKLLQSTGLDLPFITVSGTIGEEVAVATMKAGAHDYLMKGKLARLVPAVERELREAEERRERRRMEAELLASEVRYRRLFESAKDGILIINADTGTVVDVNPYLLEALGVPREQFVGKKAWEIGSLQAIMPDQAGFTALRGQANVRFEDKPLVATDGRRIEVEFVSTVYPVDHHLVMQCNFRDITERKEVEEALRRSEIHFRALTDHSLDIVTLIDRDGIVRYVSPSSVRVLGWTLAEQIGRSAFGLIHPDDTNKVRSLFAEKLPVAGAIETVEFRFQHKDGSWRVLEAIASNLLHDPTVAGIVINSRDITERKTTEIALRLFRTVIDQSRDGIKVVECRTGRIVDVNESACRDLGYTREELLELTISEVIVGLDRATYLDTLVRLRQSGHVIFESTQRRKDGSVYPIEVVLSLVALDHEYVLGIDRDITARRQAELALQASEAELKEAQRIAHVGSWQLDLATNRVIWTEELYRMFGLDPAGLPPDYTKHQQLFTADSWHRLSTALESTRVTGVPYALELEMIRADGSGGWMLARGEVFRDASGVIVGLRGTAQDITARKQAEKALRASEAQLASAAKIAGLGAWEYDVVSDRFTFNDQFYAMLRTTAEREGGYVMSSARYAERFVHPDDLAVVATEIRRAWESADPKYSRQLEHRMIYADGEIGHLAVRFFAARDEHGRVVGAYGVNQDITERVRAEESLRREQALFQSLVGAIPDNLYFKDRQSRFVQINDYMARRCGLGSSAEAVGKSDFDFFTEEHARQAYADEQRIMSTGEPMIGVEEKETWPDGRVSWVSSTKVPLRDAEGRITGLVGISRDITDRRKLEAQFIQSQKLEAFGQLAGGVAHDFNNILGVMLMQLNLLQMESGLSGAVVSGLAELERHAMRGAGLTRQLLMFSRRREMEPRMLDLNVVLEDVSKMLRRLLGEDIAFALHKAPAPLWIEGDAGMVEQVVMNLCINARDAMQNGGQLTVALRSEVRAAPASAGGLMGEYCCLAVTDVGCGMDEATKARIFEPFFTTKPTGKGTGLGLATVYGIMQQHRGWVEVDSAPNRGSTFRAYFPCREPQVSAVDAAAVREVPGGHESILLVEDEPALRQSMTACLQHAGYRVMEAANGVEALGKWEEGHHEFDLLITDFVMPEGMTGLQLAAQLSRAKAGLRVIIMSGYIPGARDSAMPWPEEMIRLMKPFETRRLLQTVRQCLDAK